jgi:hypothetical protein
MIWAELPKIAPIAPQRGTAMRQPVRTQGANFDKNGIFFELGKTVSLRE